MDFKFLLPCFFVLMFLVTTDGNAQSNQRVPITPERMFVPEAFLESEPVTIFIEGYLPNSCYSLESPEIGINNQSGVLEVRLVASLNDLRADYICTQRIVPFSKEINIGHLLPGEYTIHNPESEQSFEIEVTNDSHLDQKLAAVDQASLTWEGHTIQLLGNFLDSCQTWGKTQTQLNGNVVTVLPLVNNGTRENCADSITPFDFIFAVEHDFEPGQRYLVHVKSSADKAINFVVQK